MLRTVGPQGSLFELLLPAGMSVLTGELAVIDAGYTRVCQLVSDSISLHRFCRIGLEARGPDESTIRKITVRWWPGADRATTHRARRGRVGSGRGRSARQRRVPWLPLRRWSW